MANSPSNKPTGLAKYGDLKGRLIFLLLALIVYRIGAHVPVPGIDPDMLRQLFDEQKGGILGLFNMFSGGALSRFSVFALGIMPYISAAIIMQMLSYVLPSLEALRKEGESGRRKITQYTRYGTLLLGFFQAIGIAVALESQAGLVLMPGLMFRFTCAVSLVTGTMFLMWLGEQITERGLGNGISIILFVSIVARFPNSIIRQINNVANGDLAWWVLVLMYLGALLLIVMIVLVNDAERRLPVQYSKRVVGRKMYGGQSTHLPMKVNMSGVLPIIFAQSIASLPATICAFVPKWQNGWVMKHIFDTTTWPYIVIYFLLIIFFSYFYSTIQFNPIEVANNLKKNGGFIPGFRAGKPTSEFIQKVLNKITLFGAIYLSVIAITPLIISACSQAEQLTGISLGGTSIIIVVGVALETVRALEAQMLMRNYKGFLS